METWDFLIIGGGAAGFFAAIVAAEAAPALRIAISERSGQPLAKVKISGGGRCNLTHACFDPSILVNAYPRGSKELRGPFNRFQPQDTMAWFEQHGVKLVTEKDGRVFPASGSSQTVVDCLLDHASRLGIKVFIHTGIHALNKEANLFAASTSSGQSIFCRMALLAAGGNSTTAYKLASGLGHTVLPPAPSLFTFSISDPRLAGLAGISIPNAELSLQQPASRPLRASGPLLITHWGLSGPAILRLSAWGARLLAEANYHAGLNICWLPGISQNEMEARFRQLRAEFPEKSILAHCPFEPIPARLWRCLAAQAGILSEARWDSLSNKHIEALSNELLRGRYTINGKGAFKEEFVTCGGVSLKEVDFRTMQSRICPGLYFAGEILDIDGLTGGFNLQAAWTTGYLAGQAVARARP